MNKTHIPPDQDISSDKNPWEVSMDNSEVLVEQEINQPQKMDPSLKSPFKPMSI